MTVAENSLKLETYQLLPDVADEQDGCLARLEAALQGRPEIQRAHLERERNPAAICLHYDPALISAAKLHRLAGQAARAIARRYHHKTVSIQGMDCSDCALVVEHSLQRLPGVLSARVAFAAQTLQVEYDAGLTSQRAIERRIANLGYQVPPAGLKRWFRSNQELLFSLLAGVALLAGWLLERFFAFPPGASLGPYLLAYTLGGYGVARHALEALRARRLDTDLLMLAAALGAAALGDWAEGGLLLFLFSLGHALEERTLDRARQAIHALASLAPKTALVRRGDETAVVPVEALQIGAEVIVPAGVRAPVDGEVVAGASAVNQAPVTGEALPVPVGPGDQIFAGSVNGNGALAVRVTRLARDSTLARVVQLVEQAQAQKSPTQLSVEKFTRLFTPAVLAGVLLLAAVPPLFGVPLAEAFRRALVLLVAASPCALALGSPAAVLAGIAQAARNGVLIKGGAHLESLGRLQALAFDKTGTITSGQPQVISVIPDPQFAWQRTVEPMAEILRLAAAVENHSAHPLAGAVLRAAQDQGLSLPAAGDLQALPGLGLRARLGGAVVLLGSPGWLQAEDVPLSAEMLHQVENLETGGQTVLALAVGGQLAGLLGLADTLRPQAAAAIASLKGLGIRETVMLTGDNAVVAQAIARQAGLSAFKAGLLPESKLTALRGLLGRHKTVGMVGDGINDAPALAGATVGIAMGGAATDVALETADVALLADDLSKLPFAISLGQAARAVIHQNLAIALGVIAVLVALALSGLAGIGLAILLHEGSTLLVVLNALRLLNHRPRPVVSSSLRTSGGQA